MGRNISCIIELGYPIIKTSKGFYLNRKKFTVDEVNFVFSAILASLDKSLREREEIVRCILEILNKINRR